MQSIFFIFVNFNLRLCFFIRGMGYDRFGVPLEKIEYDGSSGEESPTATV